MQNSYIKADLMLSTNSDDNGTAEEPSGADAGGPQPMLLSQGEPCVLQLVLIFFSATLVCPDSFEFTRRAIAGAGPSGWGAAAAAAAAQPEDAWDGLKECVLCSALPTFRYTHFTVRH